MNKEGFFLLQGLDTRLSKDLPLDLQKIRCKVNFVVDCPVFCNSQILETTEGLLILYRMFLFQVSFDALIFAAPIRALGKRIAKRMWEEGPYIALHLRLEKDAWVRMRCLPGLGSEYNQIIIEERRIHPALPTSRSDMTYTDRKLVGLCPLNVMEIARLFSFTFLLF